MHKKLRWGGKQLLSTSCLGAATPRDSAVLELATLCCASAGVDSASCGRESENTEAPTLMDRACSEVGQSYEASAPT